MWLFQFTFEWVGLSIKKNSGFKYLDNLLSDKWNYCLEVVQEIIKNSLKSEEEKQLFFVQQKYPCLLSPLSANAPVCVVKNIYKNLGEVADVNRKISNK